MSLFCYALLCVHSSFAIILSGWESWLLCYYCIVTINVLRLFLVVPWVGLLYVLVVFPDHSHLLSDMCFVMHLVGRRVDSHTLSYINQPK